MGPGLQLPQILCFGGDTWALPTQTCGPFLAPGLWLRTGSEFLFRSLLGNAGARLFTSIVPHPPGGSVLLQNPACSVPGLGNRLPVSLSPACVRLTLPRPLALHIFTHVPCCPVAHGPGCQLLAWPLYARLTSSSSSKSGHGLSQSPRPCPYVRKARP